MPHGARRLAATEAFPNQAFRLDHGVFGVQFHPEVNAEALAIWHERNRRRPVGALSEAERMAQLADAAVHDAAINRWLDDFLSDWTTPVSPDG